MLTRSIYVCISMYILTCMYKYTHVYHPICMYFALQTKHDAGGKESWQRLSQFWAWIRKKKRLVYTYICIYVYMHMYVYIYICTCIFMWISRTNKFLVCMLTRKLKAILLVACLQRRNSNHTTLPTKQSQTGENCLPQKITAKARCCAAGAPEGQKCFKLLKLRTRSNVSNDAEALPPPFPPPPPPAAGCIYGAGGADGNDAWVAKDILKSQLCS